MLNCVNLQEFGFLLHNKKVNSSTEVGPCPHRSDHGLINVVNCLPKGRLSEGSHEIQGCCSQKCSRGGGGWVCHTGVGWVIHGWDDAYNALSPSAHSTTWYLLGITGGAKFNYNHTPNYLELPRENR